MSKTINARITHKNDTAINWALAKNFVPKKGELIIFNPDSTTYGPTESTDSAGNTFTYQSSEQVRLKIGDGITNVNLLPFINTEAMSEIYIGTERPTDENIKIWINPDAISSGSGSAETIIGEISAENVKYSTQGSFVHQQGFDGTLHEAIYDITDAIANNYGNSQQALYDVNELRGNVNTLSENMNSMGESFGLALWGEDGVVPKISALETYVYNSDPSLLGLEVDFVNNKFTRLCGAKNLFPGEDFNRFKMYGQRRRCNVDDDGNILNFYGDEEATPCKLKIYNGTVEFSDYHTFNETGFYTKDIKTPIYHQLQGVEELSGNNYMFPYEYIVSFNLNVQTSLGEFDLPIQGLPPGIEYPAIITIPQIGEAKVYIKIDGEVNTADDKEIYNYTGKFTLGVGEELYSLGLNSATVSITTVNLYNYNEIGFHGQVMVYQPKFYYQIVPVDINTTSSGVNKLNKVRYYICDNPIPGFKLHPAFYDKNGNEVDYILYSAYEGTRMSMEKGFAKESDLRNIIDLNLDYDVLCSVAGQQPASGMRDNLTKTNFEKIAQNRGENWHIETAQAVAANQLLMMIEYGKLNLQQEIGLGVTTINGYINQSGVIRNGSVFTGSTTELGNNTGSATMSTRLTPGFYDTDYSNMFTEELIWNGTRSISYRGMENPWGNIFKFINGLTVNAYGLVYINPDHLNNVTPILTNCKMTGYGGYISKFNYIQDYDWLFIPIETHGSSAEPVGDFYTAGFGNNTSFYYGGRHFYDTSDSNGYSGIFCLSGQDDGNNNSLHRGDIGARLIYVPTADVEEV